MDDKIVTEIIRKEGGLVNNPHDRGGITKFGITKQTLAWHLGRPVTDDDIRNLTVEVARDIYSRRYISGPGFDKLPDCVLKSNLIDFGVMSGPMVAVMHLQECLGITSDGVIGPQTLAATHASDLTTLNLQLVKRRCLMAARICKKDPSQLTFLVGWLSRFLSFL